jgi:hypothetical protein
MKVGWHSRPPLQHHPLHSHSLVHQVVDSLDLKQQLKEDLQEEHKVGLRRLQRRLQTLKRGS